jgi:polysaccharide export outer membrane protein
MKRFYLAGLACIALLTLSCGNTKNLVYFSDVASTSISDPSGNTIYKNNEAVIHPDDILSISVSSLSTEAATMFNAPNEKVGPSLPASGTASLTSGYLVSQSGDIQFPVIGNLHVAGMTKTELSMFLAKSLKERELLLDPIVTIRFLNNRVTVLGEVAKPGVYTVPVEKLSLLEVIGMAGDLTMYGNRQNILLIRDAGNNEKVYKRINLQSKDILTSPYYFLKSNDVIYVEPSRDKVTIEKTSLALPIIFSLISLVIVAIGQFN